MGIQPYLIRVIIFSLLCSKAHAACVDNNTMCTTWVQQGFCSNTYYTCQNLLDYCSFSCNVASCNPQTPCLSINVPTTTCSDNNTLCSVWQSSGFCENTWYTCEQRQQYCAATCNIGGCNPQMTCTGAPSGSAGSPVGSDPSLCIDNNSICTEWVANGFCDSTWYNCSLKQSYCAASCNILSCNPQTPCLGSAPSGPVASPGSLIVNGPCIDNSTNCLNWKANGFCLNNFYTCDYKVSYCAASCNIQACSAYSACSGNTGCVDLSPRCAAWAATGFCQNPFYDDTYRCSYCPMTCGLCNRCTPAPATTLAPAPTPGSTAGGTPAPVGTTKASGTTGAQAGSTTRRGSGTTAGTPAPGVTTETPAQRSTTKRGSSGSGTTATGGTPPTGGTTGAQAGSTTRRGSGTTGATGGTPVPGGTTEAPTSGGSTTRRGSGTTATGGTPAAGGTTNAQGGTTTRRGSGGSGTTGGTPAAGDTPVPGGTTEAPVPGGSTTRKGSGGSGTTVTGGTPAAGGTTGTQAGTTTRKGSGGSGTTATEGAPVPGGTTKAPVQGGSTTRRGSGGSGTTAAAGGTPAAGGTTGAQAGSTTRKGGSGTTASAGGPPAPVGTTQANGGATTVATVRTTATRPRGG